MMKLMHAIQKLLKTATCVEVAPPSFPGSSSNDIIYVKVASVHANSNIRDQSQGSGI